MKTFVVAVLFCACLVLSSGLSGCVFGTPSSGSGSGNQPQGGGTGGSSQISAPIHTEEWVLPIIVSITGNDADAGLAAAWGFDYGVKVINEHGGIRGLPATISIRDAASSSAGVTSEIAYASVEALIVMGPADEELYVAGEEAFYNEGLPTVGAATDVVRREESRPFAISCISEPGSEAVSAAEAWVKTERFSKVCMLFFGIYEERNTMAESVLLASRKEVVEKIEIGSAAFDAASAAEQALESEADAFYIDTGGEEALRIIRQLRFLAGENANKLKILCGPGLAVPELIESAEAGELDGVRVWATVDPNKDAEKRKAFEEAYEKNVGDPEYYAMAVDYYQSALMLEQSIEALALTGAPDMLAFERERLATYLYDTGLFVTDQGDFYIANGSKRTAAKLFIIKEKAIIFG